MTRNGWWCCGGPFGEHERTCPNFDPAADGIEVEVIRREMQIAAGVALHWADRDGHILCPPMTTAEASAKGIPV